MNINQDSYNKHTYTRVVEESNEADDSNFIKVPHKHKQPQLQHSRTKDSEAEKERKMIQLASLEGFGLNQYNPGKLALLQEHMLANNNTIHEYN